MRLDNKRANTCSVIITLHAYYNIMLPAALHYALNHATYLSVVGYEHYLLPSAREKIVEQL